MIFPCRKPSSKFSIPAAGAMLAAGFLVFAAGVQAAGAPPPATTTTTATAAQAGEPGAGTVEQGRRVFAEAGCKACHRLKDAGATGVSGPSLDGNDALTGKLVVERVTYGQLDMPGFAGLLTDEEIAAVATYVTAVAED